MDSKLLTGMVPANMELLTGTVPVNNFIKKTDIGTPFYCNPDEQ